MDRAQAKQLEFVPRPGGPPLAIAHSEGVHLVTPDGRRILDAAGGAIVVNIGHGRREVAEVAARALERTAYLVPPFASEERLRLVERLTSRWLPAGLRRVMFTSGGSESVDAALRVARQHFVARGEPERFKVIGRELSYHGTTLSTLGVGGHGKRRADFGPLLPELPQAPACYCFRCPLERSHPECGVACADAVADAIERAGPREVAAVIAEPVVGSAAGALVPPPEYWPRLSEVCRSYGVLLIADEVMTGFGRTGRRFAVEHWNVTPDILVGGKGLAGGYAPMGGVFASEEVMAPIGAAGGDVMFYTFSAHPAACAVADAVLEILEREDLVRRAAQMGERLRKALAPLEQHPHVGDVRGLGLLQGVELVRDRDTGEPFPADAGLTGRVVAAGLRRGVFFYPAGSGSARDAILLGPPFTIEPEHVDQIAVTLRAAIDDAVRGLP